MKFSDYVSLMLNEEAPPVGNPTAIAAQIAKAIGEEHLKQYEDNPVLIVNILTQLKPLIDQTIRAQRQKAAAQGPQQAAAPALQQQQ